MEGSFARWRYMGIVLVFLVLVALEKRTGLILQPRTPRATSEDKTVGEEVASEEVSLAEVQETHMVEDEEGDDDEEGHTLRPDTSNRESSSLSQAVDKLLADETAVSSFPRGRVISAGLLRERLGQSNGDFLGAGLFPVSFTNLTLSQAQTRVHDQLASVEYDCKRSEDFGRKAQDNKYEVCLDGDLVPQKNDCLIYSFGINRDWTYEDEMFDKFKCETHTYDPGTGYEDSIRKVPNYYFHNLGVWSKHWENTKGWQHETFQTMLETNRHTGNTIDMIKMHIDGPEWVALQEMLASHTLDTVRQMAVVLHAPRWQLRQETMNLVDYGEVYSTLIQLREAGFRVWKADIQSTSYCAWHAELVSRQVAGEQICAYKMYYVNKKYV